MPFLHCHAHLWGGEEKRGEREEPWGGEEEKDVDEIW